MKNSNDTIGNQTRDLQACSAVPQPTAATYSEIRRGHLQIQNRNVSVWGNLTPRSAKHMTNVTDTFILNNRRSQWPRGLRRGSVVDRLLGLWVRLDVCLL
jgi:hypothetical protein